MSNSKVKITDRILSAVLALIMIIGITPITVFASTDANPESFTICVTDKADNTQIDDATVSYKITVNGKQKSKNTANISMGEAVITDMKKYAKDIADNKKVILEYSILKTGYVTKKHTHKVTDINENIDVKIQKKSKQTVPVSVTKIGNGTVKINDEVTNTTTVDKDSNVKLEFIPDENCYIKELIIQDNQMSVEKGQSFIANISAAEDITASVTFVQEYKVSVTKNKGGSVKLNDAAVTSQKYDEDTNLQLDVKPDNGYQIASVAINGVGETISDVSSFSKNICLKENTSIEVKFVKVYTITVKYNENGTVTTSPASEGGSVTVESGTDVEITATPAADYRVSFVRINKSQSKFSDNRYVESNPYIRSLNVKKDYDIEVTFAPKIYKITVNETSADPSAGTVAVNKKVVEHNGEAKVTIKPASGYTVESVKVNDIDFDVDQPDDNTYSFVISNIKEDKNITVIFKSITAATMNDFSFNKDEAVRSNDSGTLYVFPKNSTVTFKTDKDGIRINGDKSNKEAYKTQSVSITKTKAIKKIELYYKASDECTKSWHSVDTVTKEAPLKIIIDETEPEPYITPVEANVNGYYNDNVSVALKAIDPGNYSGLKSVEYWITTDGKKTKEKTLYTYKDGDKKLSKKSFNIIVKAKENNSDNVVITLKVTDLAGNEKTKSETLKINCTKPVISVDIDGIRHKEAAEGYYNTSRTATITIKDRESTFDEKAATDGINILAKNAEGQTIDISKTAMIQWKKHNGDFHVATVEFNTDAIYNWSISYKNKADLSNDGIVNKGDSIYSFTIDKGVPDASVSIDGTTWNSLISTLTFGLWKNYSVSVSASASDNISPIYDILYYKSNSDTALSKEELVSLYNDGKFSKEPISINADEQFTVYVRATDYAGNTRYISSDGVIVDMTEGVITLTPDKPNKNGYYNKDVNVKVEVNEEKFAGVAYSGIKTVDYEVIKTDKKGTSVTQEGNLYTFDQTEPTKEQLKKEFTENIVVDKDKNNADNIKVVVKVQDNAGNNYSDSVTLAINTTQPTIAVKFDDTAKKVVEGRGYFDADRTAVVTIVDRASTFDADAATNGIKIEAIDAKGNKLTLDTAAMISAWTNDDDTHTAYITFDKDGNYTWSVEYTNKADISSKEPVHTDGTTPFTFTVDKTNPTASIKTNENIWDKLLNVLTFGLYSNSKVDVTAAYDDATSPYVVEYYKTSDTAAKTEDELNDLYAQGRFSIYSDFSIDEDEQFVIYLRVTDYAGKYVYVNSDGYILDKIASEITLTPSKANGFYDETKNKENQYGIYNKKSDVKVDVKVTDAEPYSGIKTVDYWIENNNSKTQEGNLFTFDNAAPTQAELVNEWNGTISVDKEKNNDCNIVVYVKTVDNAGNENTESVRLDIDNTAPVIKVKYKDSANENAKAGYYTARTATIIITERTHHFDPKAATDGIVITAKDVKGKAVTGAYKISSWTTAENSSNPDKTTHAATITFNKDANYTFAVGYTDKAGNANETVNVSGQTAPYKFTVDSTAPTGTIKAVSAEGRKAEWKDLKTFLTFGFWSNKKITITGTQNDVTSPIARVEYYKVAARHANDGTAALRASDLDAVTAWNKFTSLEVLANEQFTVYLRIMDNAGNYTYISTNGLIVDDQKPLEESIAPEITVNPTQPINGIYNGDVKVSIGVQDPMVNGTYSGLKEISYKVFNRAADSSNPTQEGVLYSFNKAEPKQSDLLQKWTGEITVDSAKNNSNDIQIVVYAKDNADNSSDNSIKIKIDTTAPRIDIRYDNNTFNGDNFFKADRIATIVVTERNFKSDDVKIKIKNTDGVIPAVSGWRKSEGTGNLDNTTWTATITYNADGDYEFGIEYTDLAGNKCSGEKYADGTAAPKAFTIDKTNPVIDVSYDNNSAQNGNYYKAERTATIVITEHNFNAEQVNITLKASDDGVAITAPAVSGWTSNGDRNIATIAYKADGYYTFDIAVKDKAGNSSADFAEQSFYVDKTAPKLSITGISNNSANNGDVIPVISYSDTNYDKNKVTITLNGAVRKAVELDGSYTDQHNGQIFTFKNFTKEKWADDIYTLTAALTDKAGNTSSQTITFSVNRFGSTYALSKDFEKMNGSYVKDPQDVVIIETNANELKNIKITLFKNDETITLKESDYKVDVTGDSGQWYKYVYTIYAKNFADDGVYRLTIHSEDTAGNVAENILDTKDKEINFGVDNTPPIVNIKNLESKTTYATESKNVEMSVKDNLKLVKVIAELDGKEYKVWSGDELDKIVKDGGNFTFDISGASTAAHKLVVYAVDAAGNGEKISETNLPDNAAVVEDFFVTTNIWVRYYNNKALFFGSIGGVILLTGLIIVLVVIKKKKNEK